MSSPALTAKIRSVLELHAFITEVVNTFEFSLTEESQHIRREACDVTAPTVERARWTRVHNFPSE
ncbi:hypothetical protein F5146DRAFT_1078816 [Armillaria mellea]|nr:hypothetical protein F5146DRAFT_1078816 [Armillaria mellea]